MFPRMNCSVKFFEPTVMVPLLPAPETGLMRLPAYLPVPEEDELPELPLEPDELLSELEPQPAASRPSAATTAPAAIFRRGRVTLSRGSLPEWTAAGTAAASYGCGDATRARRGG